jgi:hypothetical protein
MATCYLVRHPRTGMFIANNEKRNPRFGYRCGFGQDYKWVRAIEQAAQFNCYANAELPAIFLNLADAQICPLLSCGLLGDPITREQAMANGTFHREDVSA